MSLITKHSGSSDCTDANGAAEPNARRAAVNHAIGAMSLRIQFGNNPFPLSYCPTAAAHRNDLPHLSPSRRTRAAMLHIGEK